MRYGIPIDFVAHPLHVSRVILHHEVGRAYRLMSTKMDKDTIMVCIARSAGSARANYESMILNGAATLYKLFNDVDPQNMEYFSRFKLMNCPREIDDDYELIDHSIDNVENRDELPNSHVLKTCPATLTLVFKLKVHVNYDAPSVENVCV